MDILDIPIKEGFFRIEFSLLSLYIYEKSMINIISLAISIVLKMGNDRVLSRFQINKLKINNTIVAIDAIFEKLNNLFIMIKF
jgi:hypothetical protein